MSETAKQIENQFPVEHETSEVNSPLAQFVPPEMQSACDEAEHVISLHSRRPVASSTHLSVFQYLGSIPILLF